MQKYQKYSGWQPIPPIYQIYLKPLKILNIKSYMIWIYSFKCKSIKSIQGDIHSHPSLVQDGKNAKHLTQLVWNHDGEIIQKMGNHPKSKPVTRTLFSSSLSTMYVSMMNCIHDVCEFVENLPLWKFIYFLQNVCRIFFYRYHVCPGFQCLYNCFVILICVLSERGFEIAASKPFGKRFSDFLSRRQEFNKYISKLDAKYIFGN